MQEKTECIISDILKSVPLKTRFNINNQMMMIDLLTELGYRDGYWTDEEDEKLEKLCKIAEKLTESQIEELKQWEEDGKPE